MSRDLTVTDRLLIQAAAAGDLESRESRGYDDDDKPEGWPVVCYRGAAVSTDDSGRLGSLERHGYLEIPELGLVTPTAAGLEAIR